MKRYGRTRTGYDVVGTKDGRAREKRKAEQSIIEPTVVIPAGANGGTPCPDCLMPLAMGCACNEAT